MKKLVAMVALLAAVPVANAADSKGDFTHNAEYRVRYLYEQNQDGVKDNGENYNTFSHRFKLDMGFKSGDKFGAFASFIYGGVWGDTGGQSGLIPEHYNNHVSNLALVNQAYGTWMLSDSLTAKFGRGGFTMADGTVISQNMWEVTPYAFDGVLLNWDHEMVRSTFFFVKAQDVGLSASAAINNDKDIETNLFGGSFDLKSTPEFLKMVSFHVLKVDADSRTVTTPFAGELGKSVMRYGIVLGGDTANIDYHFDYAAHSGKLYVDPGTSASKQDQAGSMMQLDVGFSMPEMMKSRVHVAYHSDTGDKASTADKQEGYDGFYAEKHCTAGCMDVITFGNLNFINVGYTFQPMDQFDVSLQWWNFNRSEDASASTQNSNGSILAAGTGTNKAIGSEIDLIATKKYDGGLQMQGRLGMFSPGTYLKDGGAKDTYTQAYVEAAMTF